MYLYKITMAQMDPWLDISNIPYFEERCHAMKKGARCHFEYISFSRMKLFCC